MDTELLVINGEPVTPLTHAFKDGKPVLNKDGTPRKKMGRKFGSKNLPKSIVAPTEAPAASIAVGGDAEVAVALAQQEAADKKPPTANNAAFAVGALAATSAPEMESPVVPVTLPKVQAPATLTVARTYGKIGAPESQDETIEVKNFRVQPAQVEIGYGLTLNIGNYESARVDVKVSVPCYAEEVNEAYEWAKNFAEERVRQEVQSVRKMVVPQKSNPF
jgi:hypothetical protein